MQTIATVTWVMVACWLLSPLTAMAAEESEAVRVAVFDFELIDTSLGGETRGADPAEAARLDMLGEHLRRFFAAAPGVALADTGVLRDSAAGPKLHACNGCAGKLAAEAGADLAVTGTVQKVSNLILNINIYVEDVATGKMVQAASADIRGNTDQSWCRGLKWLIKNRLMSFAPGGSEATSPTCAP